MVTLLYCVCVLILCDSVKHIDGQKLIEKRILVPENFDIYAEITKLTNKVNEQQLEIRNLTSRLSGKELDVQALKTAIDTLSNEGKESGSTYTRWGKTTCPANTELVYKGYMAGTDHHTAGGGVTFLCLTDDPQWDYYDENITSSMITGVEYDFYNFRVQGTSQFFGKDVYNDNAPCAVCHSVRGASVMIPGRTECFNGWTVEYSGYMVGEYDTSKHPSEFVCLDRRPEAVVGGKNNDNEAVLEFLEAKCGKSMECPPYINGREITCVVCTK